MKQGKRLFTAFCCIVLILLPGCEFLEECGTCEFVTVENGVESYGTPLPYCGDALKEKQNSSPETVGGITTYWNCY